MITYRILKKLDAQKVRKFNEVFLVELLPSKVPAILKVMKKTEKNHYFGELLRKESYLQFEHPNLPRTLLFEEDEKELKILKTYFPGEPLNEYWKTIPSKSRIEFTGHFLRKIKGLFDELNSKHIVHGDIKPSNIIIQTKGTDFELYLIDFGLSFKPEESSNRKIIFSLAYSPPEFILNKLSLANQSSDIYSLGICLYQLFSGKLPFHHPNPAIMTNLQVTYPIENLHGIPKDIFRLVEKMCAKERFKTSPNLLSPEKVNQVLLDGIAKRYQSLDELILDFEKISLEKDNSYFKRLIKIFSKS